MSHLAIGYVTYLLTTIGITVFVGRTLHKHGQLFLNDVFRGNVALAETINHLLLVGFYLTNLAFVLLMLRVPRPSAEIMEIVTLFTEKLGIVLTSLGIMHFGNVTVLLLVRRHVRRIPEPIVTFLD